MARYQVVAVPRPQGWLPARPDDVPPQPDKPLEVLAEADDLLAAVRQAIEHNQDPRRAEGRWAVVVEPGSRGRTWPAARLCTPIVYKVTAIWWPEGWEPDSPLDVPNCVWQAQGRPAEKAMSYPEAEAAIRGLNRQCMSQPGTTWYVVVAVENEPVSQTVSYDSAGTETTVEIRRLHVIRPEQGGRGNCAHCPAHSLQCAQSEWAPSTNAEFLEVIEQARRERAAGQNISLSSMKEDFGV
jgi:hypothetical protein